MDEKKKKLLKILKKARKLAEQGKCDEALDWLRNIFTPLEKEVFGSSNVGLARDFDLARNAIVNMCFTIDGNEKFKKTYEKIVKQGKKDSLTLIAKIEEQLS